MGPTPAGFLAFIRQVMGITTSQLPDSSIYIRYAYNNAIMVVNVAIAGMGCGGDPSLPSLYAEAVYNLAGDRLINFAQDVASPPVYKDDLPFFQYMRKSFNILGFVGGVIQASADEGTSESMVVPEAMKMFTMRDLQTLKTPWGRNYMAIAQDYGYPVGVS